MSSQFDIVDDNDEFVYAFYEDGMDIIEYRTGTTISDILSNIDDAEYPDPELPRMNENRLRSIFQVIGIDIREWI